MTVVLSAETEARVVERAVREGRDASSVADALIVAALEWEAQDRLEMADGIRRGLADSDAGRVRPFAEFAAEMRERHNLPVHLSDEELTAAQEPTPL